MSNKNTWKETLQQDMPDYLAKEIDIFEGQMELRKQGKLDEKVFAETRLRRGVYGQRYDNGQRHDGIRTRSLDFPSGETVKGPNTLWDAPGMMRIKLPFGGMTPEQMDVLAQIADEYSEGLLHITTRQDIQVHYVHIEDTPDLMRRLAAVGITTREACGNSIRNITACPLSGICHDESFDVTPYSHAMAHFLLGHDDVQDFGRKFKIAFSGCEQHACALVSMHDLGLLARTEVIGGEIKRGFRIYVGGGLGAVPHQAKILYDFLPEEDILKLAQAISRVFAKHGEKRNRSRARIKFLVAQLGVEAFKSLIEEELQTLPPDERHTSFLRDIEHYREEPLKQGLTLNGTPLPDGFHDWYRTNIYRQRQPGYSVVTVNLPLGDITSLQMFQLADIARKYCGDAVRVTVEQNIVLRWVPDADLPALYRELAVIGLADAGAGTIVDITSCPGTDTCKLGIASSRGLAGELRTRLTVKNATLPDAIKDLKIKVSGCFNSCGQHHVADIGFFGNSRRSGNHKVPHFQVVLGGQWSENASSFGLAVGAVPAKRIPDVLDTITDRYIAEREEAESFQSWVKRTGKVGIKTMLKPYMQLPIFDEKDTDLFRDWGDSRVYTIDDIGVGECAGEVVSLFSFEIAKAESYHFEALVALEEGDYELADQRAFQSMLLAARSLIRTQFLDVSNDAEHIVDEFRTRFYDTKLFFDPFAKGKFARYLFSRYENPPKDFTEDHSHQLAEEAQLFIEATHAAEQRINGVIVS